MAKTLELFVNQILDNRTENAESTTYILMPTNPEALSASKVKLQITETPVNPSDLGKMAIGDVFLFEVTKTKNQKKLGDEDKE